MKNISIVLAIMATVMLAGCKQQVSEEPTALDVLKTSGNPRTYTGRSGN